MQSINNVVFSVTVVPVTNVQILRASMLPERFISDSKSQQLPIVGDDLASTVGLAEPVEDVVMPAVSS